MHIWSRRSSKPISASRKKQPKDWEDEYESDYDYHYGYRTQYEEDTTPSMKDISTGWLLTLLVNINIKSAKPILDEWYW